MVTIAQLKSWKPDGLVSLADTLNVHRRELTYLQDEVDDGKPPKSWIGGDASAATNQHNRLASDIYDNVAELVGVINALDVAGPDLKAAKELLENALHRAKGEGFDVSPTGVVTSSKEYEDQAKADAASDKMRQIADDIADAITRATQADTDLAAALNRAQADKFDTTGNLGSMSIETDLRSMSPQEQASYLMDHPDLLKAMGPTLAPEIQELIADKAASDFEDHDVSPKTVEAIAALSKEPAFAKKLFDQVSLEDLEGAVKHINDEAYPNGQVSSRADDEDVKAYKEFLSATGAAYATYTKGTGEYAPPSDLVDKWESAITSGDDGQAAALTLLLRAGGNTESYDPDFIGDLSNRIYDWERSQDGPVWRHRDDDGVINPFLTKDDKLFSSDPGYRYASDGMANLLGAMGNTPEAAEKFFSTSDGGVDQGKIKYLVTERTFSMDHRSDEGEGLGAAIAAAGIGNGDKTQWNADFTSDVFKAIADKSGSGDSGINPVDDVWRVWPGMTDDLGGLAASYSDDVYDIIGHDGVDANDADGTADLNLSQGDLDKVLGELGRGDKTGIETLNAAIVIEGEERTNAAIQAWQKENPGVPLDLEKAAAAGLSLELDGVGETNGKVLGHVINESVLVDVDDDERATKRAEYMSKAIDIGTAFIPGAGDVLGEGAGHGAKTLYDLGKSEGIAALKDQVASAPPADAGSYADSSRDVMDKQLRYSMTNQLIANGYVDGIPDSILLEGRDGKMVINPGLYDSDGVEKIGEKGRYTDEQVVQMRSDWTDFLKNHPDGNAIKSVTAQSLDSFDRELNKGEDERSGG